MKRRVSSHQLNAGFAQFTKWSIVNQGSTQTVLAHRVLLILEFYCEKLSKLFIWKFRFSQHSQVGASFDEFHNLVWGWPT